MALGEYLGAGSGTTVGLYHLNGDATDSSGNGNNGTATNVSWVGGRLGSGSASFNGSSSKIVKISPSYDFSNTAYITMSCWIKPTNVTQTSLALSIRNSTVNIAYIQLVNQVYNCGVSIGGTIQTASSGNVVTTEWQHMVGIYNGATVKGYINGKEVGTINATGNISTFTGGFWEIGTNNSTNLWFNGLIDETIIENRAWTAEEVRKYYTYTKGQFGIL